MSPKKLELDNRNKKTPPVHRFMTAKPAEETTPVQDNLPAAKEPAVVPAPPEETEPKPLSVPEKLKETVEPAVAEAVVEDKKPAPPAEDIDYKQFVQTPQETIDVMTTSRGEAQDDIKTELKAKLKAELMEELKNEIRSEMAAKIKPAVQKPVIAAPKVEKVNEPRYMFRNTMEEIVADEVAGILKNEKNMCKCSRCVNDICAIALNSIPPHYVTSDVGQLYDRAGLLDITKSNNLTVNIFKAVDHVKKKPSH